MIKSLIISLLVFITMILFRTDLCSQEAVSNTEVSITIEPKVMVADSEIYLRDLARIEANNGKSLQDLSIEEIKNIYICNAAEPGFSKIIHVEYIKSRVRQQGIKIELITWKGADRIFIETRAIRLSPQDVYSHIHNYLISQIKEQLSVTESNIHIKAVNEIQPAILPLGDVVIKVESAHLVGLTRGIIPLNVTITVNDQNYEKRTLLFEVKTFREVVTSSKNLSRNEIIQEKALKISHQDIHGFPNIFSQKEELIGKRLKRMISKDTIINSDMIEDIPLVNKGELVTIIIESPSFRITAQGKSKEDGIHGQTIRVDNTSYMKEILCQVIGDKIVRVFFP